ncbi:hypothetical protein [Hyperthermus butylicus]|uniref:Uncharacterized protein n=1 Tax=Hyperthermus butylicus (strain DSM 5456 / JCM 9403 / PLM1-5) TaxID=415426 RepID=A2BJE3_HYPBU|nr:hypothetical protein [Hyperthermus butylicus]ABM80104.1 hypothetical protein Hbut_0232 [Hyperthermus butylicus DSM 5456]
MERSLGSLQASYRVIVANAALAFILVPAALWGLAVNRSVKLFLLVEVLGGEPVLARRLALLLFATGYLPGVLLGAVLGAPLAGVLAERTMPKTLFVVFGAPRLDYASSLAYLAAIALVEAATAYLAVSHVLGRHGLREVVRGVRG